MADQRTKVERALQRARILRTVERRPVTGFTCDEIEQKLGMLHQTASARMVELEQEGHLRRGSEFRKTRTGCRARVMVPVKQCGVGRPRGK